MRNNQVVSVKNRYGKTVSFSRLNDVVVVTGYDEKYDISYKLDYSIAYDNYCNDVMKGYEGFTPISEERFSDLIHATRLVADKYSKYLITTKDIATVDPAGGRFLCVGMDLGTIHKSMFGLEVKGITITDKSIILKLKQYV